MAMNVKTTKAPNTQHLTCLFDHNFSRKIQFLNLVAYLIASTVRNRWSIKILDLIRNNPNFPKFVWKRCKRDTHFSAGQIRSGNAGLGPKSTWVVLLAMNGPSTTCRLCGGLTGSGRATVKWENDKINLLQFLHIFAHNSRMYKWKYMTFGIIR